MFLVLVPVAWGLVYLAKRPIIDSLRFDALSRSPINSLLVASLSNLQTIRAFGQAPWLVTHFQNELVDANGRAYFSYISFSRWLGAMLDYVCLFFIYSCLLASYLAPPSLSHSAAMAIASVLSLIDIFQYSIRVALQASSSLASVERMQEYTALPQEASLINQNEPKLISRARPRPLEEGSLEIRNLSMRYREGLPLVLKNVSFSVPAGTKVGIVGRTGAGKSSLLQALFRLVEAEEGSAILIGNLDVKEVGLSELRRSMLSLLPQTPFLFEGTIRENLDPFGEYSDSQLVEVLGNVQMLHKVAERA